MLIYNVGFINEGDRYDETQLNVKQRVEDGLELFNLILSLKDEMGIKEITYIDYVGHEECEKWVWKLLPQKLHYPMEQKL